MSVPEGRQDLEPDVERMHRPLFREPRDPPEGREVAPWWVWAAAVLVIFWGGWFLGRHGGTFGPETHVTYAPTVMPPPVPLPAPPSVDPLAAGKRLYAAHCQACHQDHGRGLPAAFPPLVGSEWVTGAPERVVRIVLHCLAGPVEVAGHGYSGVMPGFGTQLSDAEVSAVSTYIRQWTPNQAGPVEAETVTAVRAATRSRAQPWTQQELRALGNG